MENCYFPKFSPALWQGTALVPLHGKTVNPTDLELPMESEPFSFMEQDLSLCWLINACGERCQYLLKQNRQKDMNK